MSYSDMYRESPLSNAVDRAIAEQNSRPSSVPEMTPEIAEMWHRIGEAREVLGGHAIVLPPATVVVLAELLEQRPDDEASALWARVLRGHLTNASKEIQS